MPVENPAVEQLYSYDTVYAAVCIMEEIAAPTLDNEPWIPFRDQWGIGGVRDVVILKLAGPCDEAFDRAQLRHERDMEDYERKRMQHDYDVSFAYGTDTKPPDPPDEPPGPGAFDYEFVPFWLRECVDWSVIDQPYGPRVKGTQAVR